MALPHASVAVAIAKTGTEGQLMVDGDGNAPITGADISCTLMVWDLVETFPHPSVAVAIANTGVAGQLIVVGAGKDAITGAEIS